MKKRETYQVSKRVNRVGAAFLMGMIFHFFNYAYGVDWLNLYAAFLAILMLHFWQQQIENYSYTNKINVSAPV